jgi:hypothetical protein
MNLYDFNLYGDPSLSITPFNKRPVVVIESPKKGSIVVNSDIILTGYIQDESGIKSVGIRHEWEDGESETSGTTIDPQIYLPIEWNFTLYNGWNRITIFVFDTDGNEALESIDITYESGKVLSLPAGVVYSNNKFKDPYQIVNKLDLNPVIPGVHQEITVEPGAIVNIDYQGWCQDRFPGSPNPITQHFATYSWNEQWPPSEYYPLYDKVPPETGEYYFDSWEIEAPEEEGVYYIWICGCEHYSMEEAVNTFKQQPTVLPYGIIIVRHDIVKIVSPEPGLYFFGNKLMDMDKPFIIGGFSIEADVITPYLSSVKFFFNENLVADIQNGPFSTYVARRYIGEADIRAVVEESSGNIEEDTLRITYYKLL